MRYFADNHSVGRRPYHGCGSQTCQNRRTRGTVSQHAGPSHNISGDSTGRLRLRLPMRIQHSTLAACLVTVALCAPDDPFIGKWKVNPSKSKLTDEMKVEAL